MIQHLLMNLMLTFVWVAITGTLNFVNFLFGYILGFAILWLIERRKNKEKKQYFYRVPKIIGFILYFIYDLLKANFKIAFDVMTPNYFMSPGIVEYPLNAQNDFEITMLSNIISLTPGTLIIDVSEDRQAMYIHAMYLTDKEKFIEHIRNNIENRLLEILR
jgi:multicomponent Na+:H+ antiporter subunit E